MALPLMIGVPAVPIAPALGSGKGVAIYDELVPAGSAVKFRGWAPRAKVSTTRMRPPGSDQRSVVRAPRKPSL